MRERRTHGSVRGLRREPLVYSTIKPRSQLNTASTKPLLHGNIHNHATAVFLFPFLSLAGIAFEVFGLFKDMYKLPKLHIRQLVIIDTQPLTVKRSLFFKRASLEICDIL